MWTLLKFALLVVVIAVLAPTFAPNTAIGQFFSAAARDVTGFCDRQPVACADGLRAVVEAKNFVVGQINALSEERETLTERDRAIEPVATFEGHTAIATHDRGPDMSAN